jgi:hypothetical protein
MNTKKICYETDILHLICCICPSLSKSYFVLSLLLVYMNELHTCYLHFVYCHSLYFVTISKSARNTNVYVMINYEHC